MASSCQAAHYNYCVRRSKFDWNQLGPAQLGCAPWQPACIPASKLGPLLMCLIRLPNTMTHCLSQHKPCMESKARDEIYLFPAVISLGGM